MGSKAIDILKEDIRVYYRRLLVIALTALGISGIWCLVLILKILFRYASFPGFYWLLITESDESTLGILLVLLGSIGVFCFIQGLRSSYPEEVRRHLMTIDELRNVIVMIGAAIGVAIIFIIGVRVFLREYATMTDVSSFSTETDTYHLLQYPDIRGSSSITPFGFVKCDAHNVVCTQIEQIFVSSHAELVLRYDDVAHVLHVDGDSKLHSYPVGE